jgi:thiosulfate dehydrogenase [quinone] large subunit
VSGSAGHIPVPLGIGKKSLLVLRFFLALFFLSAAINKWQENYLFSDKLLRVFAERIQEIDPESIGAWFLEHIGLPFWQPLAWYVCWGETLIALGLCLGVLTRVSSAGAMIMMLSFAVGGYYDASLIVLALLFLPFAVLPTGRWLGLDRRFFLRYESSWFG